MSESRKRVIWGVLAFLAGIAVGQLLPRSTSDESAAWDPSVESYGEALEAAFTEPAPELRSERMRALLARLDASTLDDARRVFRDFSTRAGSMGAYEFFRRWSQIDLESLENDIGDWPDEDARAQGIGSIAYEYANRGQIPAAIVFYDGLRPQMRISAGYRLVEGAMNAGEEAALVEWIGSLDDPGDRSRLTQAAVLKVLRERDVEGVVEFFDDQVVRTRASYSRQLFLIALEKIVRRDPMAAVAFRDARASEDYARKSLRALVVAWVDRDAVAAIDWLTGRPTEPEYDETLELAIDRWASHDDAEALSWTLTQPPSPMVDRLMRRFARSRIIRDPDRSVALAARIGSDELREDALRDLARYWFSRKPAETQQWLVAGGMDLERAQDLVREFEEKRALRSSQARKSETDG